jgi:hypothetical protein
MLETNSLPSWCLAKDTVCPDLKQDTIRVGSRGRSGANHVTAFAVACHSCDRRALTRNLGRMRCSGSCSCQRQHQEWSRERLRRRRYVKSRRLCRGSEMRYELVRGAPCRPGWVGRPLSAHKPILQHTALLPVCAQASGTGSRCTWKVIRGEREMAAAASASVRATISPIQARVVTPESNSEPAMNSVVACASAAGHHAAVRRADSSDPQPCPRTPL